MEESPQLCPRCGSGLERRVGGWLACPQCDFAGEGQTLGDGAKTRSQLKFWILLFAPAALSLCAFVSMGIGHGFQSLGVVAWICGLIVGFASSIYCSLWIARRHCRPGFSMLAVTFGLMAGLGAVNLAISVAGCAGGAAFH